MITTLLALLVTVPTLHAYESGRTGDSTSGCGSCHGSADRTTTSAFAVASTTVAAGDVVPVQLLVSSTSSSRAWAGLDVSATGGTLSAGSNTRLSSGEITHSRAVAANSGTTTFRFNWTAPSAAGTYTLRGVGNAVNNNGSDSGDGWNPASDLVITVESGGGVDTGSGGGVDTGSGGGVDTGSGGGVDTGSGGGGWDDDDDDDDEHDDEHDGSGDHDSGSSDGSGGSSDSGSTDSGSSSGSHEDSDESPDSSEHDSGDAARDSGSASDSDAASDSGSASDSDAASDTGSGCSSSGADTLSLAALFLAAAAASRRRRVRGTTGERR